MSICSQCGAEFFCGVVDGVCAEKCWCMALPLKAGGELLLNADGGMQTCLCADCLHALHAQSATAQKQSPD
jgi:hypothetical protein